MPTPLKRKVQFDLSVRPNLPTAYELLVEQMGMAKAPLFLLAEEPAIRMWVRTHKNQRYIPENLLAAMGESVLAEDWE